ncbi:MAG: NYN domain-containing protein, partial [Lachnospiraceae bacterium]
MAENEVRRIAVLIDADNTSLGVLEEVLTELSLRGRIIVKRAYGNWKKEELKNWPDEINKLAIRAMQQFDYVAGKNATDIALVIDALDLLYTGNYDAFALVSSDSDYTPLAIRLHESGAYVYGFGKSNTSKSFVNACDEFIILENLIRTSHRNRSSRLNRLSRGEKTGSAGNAKLSAENQTANSAKGTLESPAGNPVKGVLENPTENPAKGTPENSAGRPMKGTPENLAGNSTKGASENFTKGTSENPTGSPGKGTSENLVAVSEAAAKNAVENAGRNLQENADKSGHTMEMDFGDHGKPESGEAVRQMDRRGEAPARAESPEIGEEVRPEVSEEDLAEIHGLLRKIWEENQNEEGFVYNSLAGILLRRIKPDFDPRTYGEKRLTDLLYRYPEHYEIVSAEN